MNIKNILVPTDFSPCSVQALKYAMGIAKKFDAEIEVVHALSLTIAYNEVTVPEAYNFTEVEAFAKFDEIKADLPELNDLTYSFLVNTGATADVVAYEAQVKKADLIVMGTEGASGMDAILFGTNAFNVINYADCPILVIPDKTKIKDPKQIGLAADYHQIPERIVFEPLITMAKTYEANIQILNVSKQNWISNQQSQEAKKLEQYFKGVAHKYHFEIEENVEEGIKHFLERQDIDLLTIVKRKHGFFERMFRTDVLKNLVFHSEIPLLIVQDHADA